MHEFCDVSKERGCTDSVSSCDSHPRIWIGFLTTGVAWPITNVPLRRYPLSQKNFADTKLPTLFLNITTRCRPCIRYLQYLSPLCRLVSQFCFVWTCPGQRTHVYEGGRGRITYHRLLLFSSRPWNVLSFAANQPRSILEERLGGSPIGHDSKS